MSSAGIKRGHQTATKPDRNQRRTGNNNNQNIDNIDSDQDDNRFHYSDSNNKRRHKVGSLSSLSPPDPPPISNDSDTFIRSSDSLTMLRSHIPYLYDFFLEFEMTWPFYTMCWGPMLSSDVIKESLLNYSKTYTASSSTESSFDPKHYTLQKLYYAQATPATMYYGRFSGIPQLLIQAEIPVPSHTQVPDMRAAATADPKLLSDIYCSYVTDKKKIAHPGEVNRIKLIPQGEDILVTHTDSPRVYLWNLPHQPHKMIKMNCYPHIPDLQLVGHIEEGIGNGPDSNPLYFALDCSNQQPYVISGGPDQRVCLWSIEDYMTSLATIKPTSIISPKDSYASTLYGSAIASSDKLLQCRSIYHGHSACVEDVTFHPSSSSLFASVGDDRLLIIWDSRLAAQPNQHQRVYTGHTDDVNSLSWNSQYDQYIVTASSDHTIKLIDIRFLSSQQQDQHHSRNHSHNNNNSQPRAVVHTFTGHTREVKNVSWSPDGLYFASGGDDGAVKIWTLKYLQLPNDPPNQQPRSSLAQHPAADPKEKRRHSERPVLGPQVPKTSSAHLFEPAASTVSASSNQSKSSKSSQQTPATSSLSISYHNYLSSLTSSSPGLIFSHELHPTAIQSLHWNHLQSPLFTLATISGAGDAGGLMQIWRMNPILYQDIEVVQKQLTHKKHKRQRKHQRQQQEQQQQQQQIQRQHPSQEQQHHHQPSTSTLQHKNNTTNNNNLHKEKSLPLPPITHYSSTTVHATRPTSNGYT